MIPVNIFSQTAKLKKIQPILRLGVAAGLAGLLLAVVLSMVLTPVYAANVTVWKVASSSTVKAGEPFTYTISVLNTGGGTLVVDIFDTLPPGVEVVDDGGGTVAGGVISWNNVYAVVNNPASVDFTVVVTQVGDVVNQQYWVYPDPDPDVYGTPITTTIIPNDPALIDIQADPDPATVGSSTDLTFSVTDIYGNNVTDDTVLTIEFDHGTIDGQTGSITATTSGGQVVKTLQTETTVGTAHITATAGAIQGAASVVVNPGPPDSLAVNSSASSISTVNSQTAAITATVVDAYGNAVADTTPVTFTTNLGQLNGSGSTVTVSPSGGDAVVSLAGTVAGTATVVAEAGTLTDSVQVYLAPGPPNDLDMTISPNRVVADGVSTATVTLDILDAHDNRVDTAVPFTLTTTLGTFPGGGTSYTDTALNGLVQVTLTAITQTGTANVNARIASTGINQVNKSVNFVPGDPVTITLTFSPPAVVADGSHFTTVSATARDAFGNPYGGYDDTIITFTLTTADGTWVENGTTTVGGVSNIGTLQKVLQSSTNLGSIPVTATATTIATPTIETVEFIVGEPDHVDVSLSHATPITAGTPISLTLTVRDNVNHIIPNVPLTVTTSTGQVTPVSTNTNAAGQIVVTLVATQAGQVNLGFTSYNGGVDNYSIDVDPDVPVNAVVSVNPSQIIANGGDTGVISARITDQYGNPVVGYTPAFTISPASAGTVANGTPAATNSEGVASGSVTANTDLGGAVVSVLTDTTLANIQSAMVSFVTGPPAAATVDVQTPASPYYVCGDLACNDTNMLTMVITVTDSVGHLLTNQSVTVTTSLGILAGAGCGLTNSGGATTCYLYSTQAGTATLSVDNVHANPAIEATGDPIYFNPGPFYKIVISPDYSFSLPFSHPAGVPKTFTAVTQDIHGNQRNDVVVWDVVSLGGDGLVSANGNIATFTGTTKGKVGVRATYGGKNKYSYVDVTAGSPVQGDVVAGALSVPVGNSVGLSIYVKDQYGNLVGAGALTPQFAPTIGVYQNTTATDSGGKATTVLYSDVAGPAQIDITNLSTVTGHTIVTFTAGVPKNVLIEADDTTLHANGTDSTPLHATITDRYGNPLGSGYKLKISTTYGGVLNNACKIGTLTGPGGTIDCTLTAPTVAATEVFAVSYWTGTSWASLTKLASSDTVRYEVGPLYRVEVSPAFEPTIPLYQVTAGVPVQFTAQGYDQYDAPVPAVDVDYLWDLIPLCFGPDCPSGEISPATGSSTTLMGRDSGASLQLTLVVDDGDFIEMQEIEVVAASPVSATITATAPVIADGVSVITYTLTDLTDQFGNISQDSEPITMTVHTMPPQILTGTISGGQVVLPLTATTRAGSYLITANSAAGSVTLIGDAEAVFLPGPPTYAEILSADPAPLVANGVATSQVRIRLKDVYSNTAAAGLSPTLTVSPTNLGTFTDQLPTNDLGVLTATLRSGVDLGDASVIVDGITAVGGPISLIPGPPVSATVTVVPTTTVVVGSSNTTATFTVYDSQGHLVADGETIDPIFNSGGGAFSGVLQTLNGVVTQTIIAGTNDMTDTLAATGLTVSGDTDFTFIPGPAAQALVQATPTDLQVLEQTDLTITITDQYGNIVPPTAITITSILTGTLDGTGPTITRTTQGGTGLITASLISSNAGTETLRLTGPAGLLSLDPASANIIFRPDNPTHVEVTPSGHITLTADVMQQIRAVSLDQYDNPVDPWVDIYYTWVQEAYVQGDSGFGTIGFNDFKLSTIDFLPKTVGQNHITATARLSDTQEIIGRDSLTVTVIPGAPAKANIILNPSNVLADGISTYAVTVTNVTDKYGNAIDQTPLTVTVQSAGRNVVSSGTTANGTLMLVMTSTIKAGDWNIVVEGHNGPLTLSGDTVVTFRPGPPTAAYVFAQKTTLPADGTSSTSLVISIEDGNGNLVGNDVPITVTTDMPEVMFVSSPVPTSTVNGVTVDGTATFVMVAPQTLGTARILVDALSSSLPVGGDSYITFIPGPPAYADITASPVKVVGDGVSRSNLVITIRDGIGHRVDTSKWADVTVDRGTIAPNLQQATNGQFTAVFTADKSVGMVDIDVIYDNYGPLQNVGDTLEQIPGLPMSATVTADLTSLKIGTSDQSNLTVSLFDASNNPVADGTVVTVTTTSDVGSLVPQTTTTVNGTVTRVLTPGLNVGTVGLAVKASPSGVGGNLPLSGDTVEVLPGNLATLEILPDNPGNLVAGTVITFTAKGYDAGGYPISGLDILWEKMLASGGDGVLTKTGAVTATFKATKTGNLGLCASQVAIYICKNLTVVPGAAASALVHADPLTITVGGGDTSDLTITARDAFNNLVANGANLNVVATRGGIVQCNGTTANGVLNCTVQAGTFYGLADIYVDGFMAGGDKVYFAAHASVTPVPDTLEADGSSQSSLAVRVVDLSGNEVPDGTSAAVTATNGRVSNCGTTINSVLNCTFTVSRTLGIAEFFVDGLQASGHITLTPGPAALARIAANPAYIMADDTSTATLTITVEDNYGHVITDAGNLNVTSSLGSIGGVEPTVNGVTHRILTSESLSQTQKAVISVEGLTAVGDKEISLAAPAINDSGFEDGTFGDWAVGQWVNWREGGSTLAYSATVLSSDIVGGISVTPPNGNRMLRLGATTPDNTDHAQSEVWIQQPLYIPATGVMQLVLSYRILSYDVMTGTGIAPADFTTVAEYAYDPFEVYVDGQLLYHDGFNYETWSDWYGAYPGPPSPQDTGWYQSKPLTLLNSVSGEHVQNAGKMVMLEFRIANNRDPSNEVYAETDNTWVYIDDISVRYLTEEEVQSAYHNVFLPVIIR